MNETKPSCDVIRCDPKSDEPRRNYVVVRVHYLSGNWKVYSRYMGDLHSVTGWKSTCEAAEKDKRHKFIIVEILSEERLTYE